MRMRMKWKRKKMTWTRTFEGEEDEKALGLPLLFYYTSRKYLHDLIGTKKVCRCISWFDLMKEKKNTEHL